jgi:hypothetical protein
MRANWPFFFAELRQHVGKQMRLGGWQHSLISKDLTLVDEKHVYGVGGIKLVDFPAVGLCQITPSAFLNEHAMPQTKCLIHFLSVFVNILSIDDMKH